MNTNSLSTKWKSLPVFKKILTIAVPAVVVIAAVVVIIMLNSGVRATTMRLLRMEGIVTLEDINGNEKSIVISDSATWSVLGLPSTPTRPQS